jgi:hypothetical protein
MVYNHARILKLMPWIRLIEWYLLAGIGVRIFVMVAYGVDFFYHPDQYHAYAGWHDVYLFMAGLALRNLSGLLIALFYYLLFLGISLTIRYLLALEDSIGRPRRKVSPDRS